MGSSGLRPSNVSEARHSVYFASPSLNSVPSSYCTAWAGRRARRSLRTASHSSAAVKTSSSSCAVSARSSSWPSSAKPALFSGWSQGYWSSQASLADLSGAFAWCTWKASCTIMPSWS
ncbi:MAG: hypothetical protein HOP15_12305 [Planctomycetes bacterium]|nr:hypothetical protein [Planctomycetota bacterium]